MKRYLTVIVIIWAFAYSVFFLAGTAGRNKAGEEDDEGGAPKRAAAVQEKFDLRFIEGTRKSSVTIEITEQRRKKGKETAPVAMEDLAASLYKQRKGPFPERGQEEFRINPDYLKGVSEARLDGSYTLLTPKGQYPMVPEGLYYMNRSRGTQFVTMKLVPKNPRTFPELGDEDKLSLPQDIFVLKQPHPPIRKMEVYTAEALPLPPEFMNPVKKQASRAFKKIKTSSRYLVHDEGARPNPNPKYTYFKLPPKTGLRLVAVYWSALGGKGYSASVLFQVKEEKGRITATKVVDVDPYNDSVLGSELKVLAINDTMFAFIANEGDHYSRQEKAYMVLPEDRPWRLVASSVHKDETAATGKGTAYVKRSR